MVAGGRGEETEKAVEISKRLQRRGRARFG
jgi:hypothetical protein